MYYANRDIKLKKIRASNRAASHIFRNDPKNDNVISSRSIENRVIIGPDNFNDYKKRLDEVLSQNASKKKIRSDANITINQVFHCSAGWLFDFKKAGITQEQWETLSVQNPEDKKVLARVWATLDKGKLDKFEKAMLEHLEKCHQHTISVVLHMDEKTPHYHVVSVPFVNKVLSAKQYYTKKTLNDWNSDFFERVKKLNLSIRRKLPDVPLSKEQYEKNDVDSPKKPSRKRYFPHKPTLIAGMFYSRKEVDKTVESYKAREEQLKEIITNSNKWIAQKTVELEQQNNLRMRYENAKKRLSQIPKGKLNYRKKSVEAAKMKKELEEKEKENNALLEELKQTREKAQEAEQKLRAIQSHKQSIT